MVILFSVEETQAEDEEDQAADEANEEEEGDEGLLLEDEFETRWTASNMPCLQLMRQSRRKKVLSSKTALWTLSCTSLALREQRRWQLPCRSSQTRLAEFIVPLQLRTKIMEACGRLHDQNKSASNFVKKYEKDGDRLCLVGVWDLNLYRAGPIFTIAS